MTLVRNNINASEIKKLTGEAEYIQIKFHCSYILFTVSQILFTAHIGTFLSSTQSQLHVLF